MFSRRFKIIVEKHRVYMAKNEHAAGIDIHYGEREKILDDLSLEVYEHEENIRELKTRKFQWRSAYLLGVNKL